jgi:hypothetical protein
MPKVQTGQAELYTQQRHHPPQSYPKQPPFNFYYLYLSLQHLLGTPKRASSLGLSLRGHYQVSKNFDASLLSTQIRHAFTATSPNLSIPIELVALGDLVTPPSRLEGNTT